VLLDMPVHETRGLLPAEAVRHHTAERHRVGRVASCLVRRPSWHAALQPGHVAGVSLDVLMRARTLALGVGIKHLILSSMQPSTQASALGSMLAATDAWSDGPQDGHVFDLQRCSMHEQYLCNGTNVNGSSIAGPDLALLDHALKACMPARCPLSALRQLLRDAALPSTAPNTTDFGSFVTGIACSPGAANECCKRALQPPTEP
jgi:hypothetical protein